MAPPSQPADGSVVPGACSGPRAATCWCARRAGRLPAVPGAGGSRADFPSCRAVLSGGRTCHHLAPTPLAAAAAGGDSPRLEGKAKASSSSCLCRFSRESTRSALCAYRYAGTLRVKPSSHRTGKHGSSKIQLTKSHRSYGARSQRHRDEET